MIGTESDMSKVNRTGGFVNLNRFKSGRALKRLKKTSDKSLRTGKSKGFVFQVIHQTGRDDLKRINFFYRSEGITAITRPFFDEMIDIYLLADLIISRSGAGTVSELSAVGKPSILIPYPYAKADHQKINALRMVKAGASKIIQERELTGDRLAKMIMEVIKDPRTLETMADASKRLGMPNSTKSICDQALLWFEEQVNAS